MEEDRVAKFVESRDESVLEECTKSQLQLVANHFGIKLKSTRVAERRIEIMAQLKAREEATVETRSQVPTSPGKTRSVGGSSGGSISSSRSVKLEMLKMQLEAQLRREELEAQLRREDREAQLQREEREREARLQMRREEIAANKEVELRRIERGLTSLPARREDLKVKERDLPTFMPHEAESFFDHFERIATLKGWPEEDWAALVQSKLVGEAREAYNMLDIEECTRYDAIKNAVLHSYKLTPEVYRKRFRECTRMSGKSYAETAREMERKFLRWLKAEEAESAEDLKRLILMEKFMSLLHPELRVRVKEAGIKDVKTAADRADMLEEALHLRREGPPRHQAYQGYGGNSSRVGGVKAGGEPPKSYLSSGKRQEYKGDRETVSRPPVRSDGFDAGARSAAKATKIGSPKRTQSTVVSGGVARVTGGGSPRRGGRCFNCGLRGHFARECGRSKQGGNVALARMEMTNANDIWKRSPVEKRIHPFVCEGTVKIGEAEPVPVRMLRDTGADFTLVSEVLFPVGYKSSGAGVATVGTLGGPVKVPLHEVTLDSDYGCQTLVVGVCASLPRMDAQVILGNDSCGGCVLPNLIKGEECVEPYWRDSETATDVDAAEIARVAFPLCAVTSGREAVDEASKSGHDREDTPDELGLDHLLETDTGGHVPDVEDPDGGIEVTLTCPLGVDNTRLRELQKEDFPDLLQEAEGGLAGPESPTHFFVDKGVLMRRWRPVRAEADSGAVGVKLQVVVPTRCRGAVLELAHSVDPAGHLGVTKTLHRIRELFYWPGMDADVRKFCKTCFQCQRAGKNVPAIPKAPLVPVPAFGQAFERLLVDVVGPLPRTKKGNNYLITIMCASTRFPEAVPVRKVTSKSVMGQLQRFFSWVGTPKEIQSDCGSVFQSRWFRQTLAGWGIKQLKSSPYRPQSQGAIERFHSTLKTMLRVYCAEQGAEWDEAIFPALFAIRDAVVESLGFSPFQLVYGHEVRSPLVMLKEQLTSGKPLVTVEEYVRKFRERLVSAKKLASEHLKAAQRKMAAWYNRNAVSREFQVGAKVMMLLPGKGRVTESRFGGPYSIVKRVGQVNYEISKPQGSRKTQICHVNRLKPYFPTEDKSISGERSTRAGQDEKLVLWMSVSPEMPTEEVIWTRAEGTRLSNTECLTRLEGKLQHLDARQRDGLVTLIREYESLFTDVPRRHKSVVHDVVVQNEKPIKQNAYRVCPEKRKIMQKEVEYLLANDLAEPSDSEWSSPCVLVKKGDGSYRFCTDYRKVNSITVSDSHPLPRISDCVDRVGNARYVSKIDLLKGYYQVSLSPSARKISAFVTPDGLYQYKVLPFGMKNSGSCFQRMMNEVLRGAEGCTVYIDDIVVYADSWNEHMTRLRELFRRLEDANLTVNLSKSEFGKARLEYLGFIVGQGEVAPVDQKVVAIKEYPAPRTRKELLRYLGMIGYYRAFCKNFSTVAYPLTELLSKNVRWKWGEACQESFAKTKKLLTESPVLISPDFGEGFILYVDASDVGIGAMLAQERNKVHRPVAFYSKKFEKYQRAYSTVEKEALALILALKHFDVYVGGGVRPVLVYTDHNPLTFVHKMKNANQRLTRWSLLLQEYWLEIRHIRGKDNVVADALSRVH